MKNMLKRLVFALPLVWTPALRAEAPPLFEPEPPEPAAAALVEAYLPLLAAGQFEQALALNDLRGMRQYLLERRLADLKTKNPELTAQELDEMSAQMQLNELAPDRLRAILLDVMQKAAYAGMTWRIQGFAPAPEGAPGYLASVAARTPDGKEKPVLLGLKKLGDQWLVAPEIVEELGRKMVVPGVQTLPPPESVAALVDDFWKRWQAGELDAAYGLFGQEYRQRVPQLAFLQQAQEFIARIGVPTSWTIVQCRRLAPDTLGLGVNVQGSRPSSRPSCCSARPAKPGPCRMPSSTCRIRPPRRPPPLRRRRPARFARICGPISRPRPRRRRPSSFRPNRQPLPARGHLPNRRRPWAPRRPNKA